MNNMRKELRRIICEIETYGDNDTVGAMPEGGNSESKLDELETYINKVGEESNVKGQIKAEKIVFEELGKLLRFDAKTKEYIISEDLYNTFRKEMLAHNWFFIKLQSIKEKP